MSGGDRAAETILHPSCDRRTQAVGTFDCECQQSPTVYGCKVHAQCILMQLSIMIAAQVNRYDGQGDRRKHLPWDSETDRGEMGPDMPRLAVCSLCESRQP